MTLIKEVECVGIIVDIEQYIPENIEFIPNQYYRNYSDCYIVDKWKRHVLKLGSLLQFQNLYTLDHEIKTIVTGTVSPYFLVQFENKTILDLSSKLSDVQFPNIEIKCGTCSNTGVILVDKFNTIHIYETSAYIKSQLGIDSNGDDERKIKFESTNKTVMGSIDEVHAGFFHVVFRTRDGRIFAAGYDNLKQCSLGANTGDCNFIEQSKLLQMDPCVRLGCLSRGQYLITSQKDIYFISEMFSNFPQSKFTHKQYNFVNVMNFDDIEIQTREFRDGSPYNTIVNAGWQCCIAFDHRLHSKPSRFRNRLFECSLNCKIPDISLNFQ